MANMKTTMAVLVLALVLCTASARKTRCKRGWRCPKPSPPPPPPPSPPPPSPSPSPATLAPIVPGIANPGFVPFDGPVPDVSGPIATSALSGSGIAQIGSGTAGTLGSGDTFSTKVDGGAATVAGSQQAFVDGVGPAAGQTGLQGGADLITPGGGRSTAAGNTGGAFLLGGGPGAASSTNTLQGVVTPVTAQTSAVAGATGTSAGGAAGSNNFNVVAIDP